MGDKIVIIAGYPGAGKSSMVKEYELKAYKNLNRDKIGSTEKLLEALDSGLGGFTRDIKAFVLDNTYGTKESRAPIIAIAKKHKVEIECYVMSTTIEEAQVNAIQRQIEKHGRMLLPDDFKTSKDPNMFSPAPQYAYRKNFEKPTVAEGFDKVGEIKFERRPYPKEYTNKAIIVDYDGTLRDTKSGDKFPVTPDDIYILPNRKETLMKYKKMGYLILGVSNQSGIAKKKLSMEMAKKCFAKTNELLGIDIDVKFCSHSVPPIICFCRKPGPGLGVEFIHQYKLNPSDCIMVGDMKTDNTFATRCGFQFKNQDEFFK